MIFENYLFKKPVLFGILVFLCSFGLFLRPTLFGLDSYAFKANVCQGFTSTLGNNPLALYFFNLMPCSLLFFKLVMFLSLVTSLYFIFLIVKKEFSERIAWQSIFLLLSLSPLLLFEFGKFENELLAYPFIIFGIYCFLNSKWFEGLAGFTASLVFWGWPYYFGFFGGSVLEQQVFSGLLPLFGLVFIFPFVFFSKNRLVLLGSGFSLFLFLLNMKFFIFFIVFVALGIAQLLKIIEDKQQVRNFLWITSVFLLLGFNIAFLLAQPTLEEHKIVSEAVEIANNQDLQIYNDWSIGYLILDKGKDTGIYGGGKETDYNDLQKPFIAITKKDLSGLGCTQINQFISSTRKIKTWKC